MSPIGPLVELSPVSEFERRCWVGERLALKRPHQQDETGGKEGGKQKTARAHSDTELPPADEQRVSHVNLSLPSGLIIGPSKP